MVHWLVMSGVDASVSLGLGRRPALIPLGLLGAVAAFLTTMAVLNAEGHTHFDVPITLAGLGVGFVVGLTGMGGGALMTPILVLLFKIQPLAAVSSDLVAALVMKPVGGAVHLRRGTVNMNLVRWLMIGSVPSAFCGVLVLRALGNSESLQNRLKVILGIVLIVASLSMVVKAIIDARRGGTSSGAL